MSKAELRRTILASLLPRRPRYATAAELHRRGAKVNPEVFATRPQQTSNALAQLRDDGRAVSQTGAFGVLIWSRA